MNEIQIQREAALSTPNITYLPDIPADALAEIKHETFSLSLIGTLGSSFSALVAELGKTAAQAGGSGLYYVNTMGKQMMSFNDGSGFLGALAKTGGGVGGGQARITPAYINPTALMMSAALASVSLKMEEIATLQRDIMDYLKQKELANLIGNINTLSDVSNNFKYNWNNEQYKTNKHNLVQVIRRDSEQSIVLNRAQIQKMLNSHKPNLAETLQAEFSSYQMSLYQFAYSSYLEVMLLGNFDPDYLKSIASKIEEYIVNWRMLYTDGYNKLEKLTNNSFRSRLMRGASTVSKGIGTAIADIPIISKTPIDEALITGSDKLEAYNKELNNKPLSRLIECSTDSVLIFIDNINAINKIYSHRNGILFDDKNIYLI